MPVRPSPSSQRAALSAIDAVLHRRRHADHVGLGDMVDPAAAVVRHLEARRLPRADQLYSDALEPGVPARDVCAGKPTARAGDRFSAAAFDLAHDGMGGAGCVAGDGDRAGAGVMAQLPRVRHRYILNTPNFVSGTGALSAAENASASTRRVSPGAMMPSSHSRAVA